MNGIEVDDNSDRIFNSISVRIGKLEDEIGNYIADRLNVLLRRRYNASGIKNRSGALNASLSVRYIASSHSIQVGMLIYGVFLSYGVGPKVKNGKIYKIDDWVLNSLSGTPRGQNTFSYEPSYRTYGIKARKFIPGDEALQAIINDFINEYETNNNS